MEIVALVLVRVMVPVVMVAVVISMMPLVMVPVVMGNLKFPYHMTRHWGLFMGHQHGQG